jgi:ATP-dependent RNA helicase DDX19/DBP5
MAASSLEERLGAKPVDGGENATNSATKDAKPSAIPAEQTEKLADQIQKVQIETEEVIVTLNSKFQIYTSISSFEELGLRKELLDGVYALGYQKPSKIQEKALPLLLHDPPVNMIGQSQAGTGKTACFSLNILSRVDSDLEKVQAIVLAPARELARQILDNIRYVFL